MKKKKKKKISSNGLEIGFIKYKSWVKIKKLSDEENDKNNKEEEIIVKSYFKITSFYINKKIGFTITSAGDHLGAVDEIKLTKDVSMKIYLSPLSIFGSYSFIWWDSHLCEFHYNILGIIYF